MYSKKGYYRKQQTFGSKTDKFFDIGLVDNHYFIIERTKNTTYSITHYDALKDLPNCNLISGVRGDTGKFKRDKAKLINSFDLVKLLIENKDRLLELIPYDVLTKTPYFSLEMNTDDLTEISKTEYKENEMVKTDNSDCYVIGFDFETFTDGKHEPYLVRCKTQDGLKSSFDGPECGKDFITYLKRLDVPHTKFLLVAHNFRYDFSFIWEHMYKVDPLISGTRLLGGSGSIYRYGGERIELKFVDSYNHISVPLKDFGEMFQLEQGKEVMPYSVYTKENFETGISIADVLECKELKDNKEDKKIFISNCEKWECDTGGYFNLLLYSDKYCEIDVSVMMTGFEKHRQSILKVCGLDTHNYLTAASVAHDYMIKRGVYDGSYKISGIPRAFIQKCVYGGKTMTRANKKFKIDTDTADFDAVSNYPSAMAEMDGVLMGLPKLLKPDECNESFLNSVDGYFIKVKCIKDPDFKLNFPIISEVADDGNRLYTNENKGKFYYLDKTTYEDCKEFVGLEFEIVCGYYYNDGRNPIVKKVIRELFNERVIKKNNVNILDNKDKILKTYEFTIDEINKGKVKTLIKKLEGEGKKVSKGNPIQAVYKLLLNSSYGKSMLKPIDTSSVVLTGDKCKKYIAKNYNYIKDILQITYDTFSVTYIKPINEHFNNVYFGVEVLSHAKRIMNRVIVNCEKLKIPVYYTDTDSLHIDYNGVATIEKFWNDKYSKQLGYKLIGKDLGQFHVDFEVKGAITETIKSKKSVYLGKKCYYDYLEGYDKDGKLYTSEHIRMKGVPEKCIHYTANKYFDGDVYKMYLHLLKENPVRFDLLQGGNAIKFKYCGFDVKSLGYYKTDATGNKIMCEYDETAESEFARTLVF